MQGFNHEIKYVKSESNIVANVFSRKPNLVVHTTSPIIRKLLVLTKFPVTDTLQKS